MKLNALILFTSCLFIFSCEKGSESELSQKFGNQHDCTISSKISLKEAFLISCGKGIHTKGIDVTIEPVLEGHDTVLFIVNYPQGWSIMPADRRLPMNLMQCDTGSMTAGELLSNNASKDILHSFMKDIQAMVSNPTDMANETQPTKSSHPPYWFYDENGVWWAYAYKYVSGKNTEKLQNPLIKTKWGQGRSGGKWNTNAPYTDASKTDHCPTGCVSVAVAQLLYYLHTKTGHPQKTYSSFYSTDYYDSTYNSAHGLSLSTANVVYSDYSDCWSSMPLYASSSNYSSGYKLVSSLMVRLGLLLHSNYSPLGAGTYIGNVAPVLSTEFGFSCTKEDYSTQIVASQLSNNKSPVIIDLALADSTVHHTFIADGYKKVKETYTYVYKTMDETSEQFKYIENSEEVTDEYVSLNWGYDGRGDRNNYGSVIWYNLGNNFTFQGVEKEYNYISTSADKGSVIHSFIDTND